MRYLSIAEVLELHERLIDASGGSTGVRDLGALESCLAQPHASFGGQELYADLITKAAALGFSLVMNHPFVDGNKRIGHAAMEVFLMLNGHEITCGVDEQERVILDLASGNLPREDFAQWVKKHTTCC
jgi:death-on-curing protein